MSFSFHAKKHQHMYAHRDVDPEWWRQMSSLVLFKNKQVVDIGCSAGIYTAILADKGSHVTGVDFSETMLATARQKYPTLAFKKGDAYSLPFSDQSVDIVFARALTHHLNDIDAFLAEAKRVLRPGGHVIIQNRTPDDCHLPGSPEHVRGYLFELFPHLNDVENKRRLARQTLLDHLRMAGFSECEAVPLWEVRQTYPSVTNWAASIFNREGRSILHELSDEQLDSYVEYVKSEVSARESIIDQDRWTVWIGGVR